MRRLIRFNIVSPHSSAFPTSTRLFPPICPVADAVRRCSWGGAPVCGVWHWTRPSCAVRNDSGGGGCLCTPWDLSLFFTRSLFLPLMPAFWGALTKNVTRHGKVEPTQWVRRMPNTFVSHPGHIYLLWHTRVKTRPVIYFVVCNLISILQVLAAFLSHCMKTFVETFSNITYGFLRIVSIILCDNGLSFRVCLFLLSFPVLDVPAVA